MSKSLCEILSDDDQKSRIADLEDALGALKESVKGLYSSTPEGIGTLLARASREKGFPKVYWKANKGRFTAWGAEASDEDVTIFFAEEDENYFIYQVSETDGEGFIRFVAETAKDIETFHEKITPLLKKMDKVLKSRGKKADPNDKTKVILISILIDQLMVGYIQSLMATSASLNTGPWMLYTRMVAEVAREMKSWTSNLDDRLRAKTVEAWVSDLAPFLSAAGIRVRGLEPGVSEFGWVKIPEGDDDEGTTEVI